MADDVVQFWCMSRKFEVGPGRRVLVINAYRLNLAGLAPPSCQTMGSGSIPSTANTSYNTTA